MAFDFPESRAPEIEKAVRSLRGVRGAKVRTRVGQIDRVSALVVPERVGDGLVREVRSIASKSAVVELEPERIELVSATSNGRGARRRLESMTIERSGSSFTAQAALELEGDVLIGRASAGISRHLEQAAVAQAVLSAAAELLDEDLRVQSADVLEVGSTRLALVVLAGSQGVLTGSAAVRVDDYDALARATLDTINRLTVASRK